MDYRIKDARYLQDYTIWVCFRDGVSGEINLADEIYGDVFESLRDINVFKRFFVHPEFHTLTWENGADFAPEFLYQAVKKAA